MYISICIHTRLSVHPSICPCIYLSVIIIMILKMLHWIYTLVASLQDDAQPLPPVLGFILSYSFSTMNSAELCNQKDIAKMRVCPRLVYQRYCGIQLALSGITPLRELRATMRNH